MDFPNGCSRSSGKGSKRGSKGGASTGPSASSGRAGGDSSSGIPRSSKKTAAAGETPRKSKAHTEEETDMKLGHDLITTVVSATGLPAPLMQKEVEGILDSSGHVAADLTLDELRVALLAYLETVGQDLFPEEAGEEVASAVSSN